MRQTLGNVGVLLRDARGTAVFAILETTGLRVSSIGEDKSAVTAEKSQILSIRDKAI